MGFGLCCITTASFCLMLGPGKALRAQSMDQIDDTIVYLKEKSFLGFWFFVLQMITFYVSSLSLMWIVYSPLVAFIVNLCLLAFLLQFLTEGYDIWERLWVNEKHAVSHDMAFIPKQRKDMGNLDGSVKSGSGRPVN